MNDVDGAWDEILVECKTLVKQLAEFAGDFRLREGHFDKTGLDPAVRMRIRTEDNKRLAELLQHNLEALRERERGKRKSRRRFI